MKLLNNDSIYKNFKTGSIIILFSFMFLIGINIFYYTSVDSYASLEEKSSNKISNNLESISNINNKTKQILENTTGLLEKNANSLELFEFIGSINKHLINLILNPNEKNKSLVINMIKNWNEKSIKYNPLLSQYYKELSQRIEDLNSYYEPDKIKELQLIFDDMYSTLIDNAYKSSDTIANSVEELKQRIDKSQKNIHDNVNIIDIIKQKRDYTHNVSFYVVVGFIIAMFAIFASLLLFKKIADNFKTDLSIFKTGLNNFFEYVNDPRKSIEPIQLNKKDEISLMAKEINTNINNIKQNLQKDQQMIKEVAEVANKIKDGCLNVKITSNPHNHSLKDLKNVINEMLKNLYKDISNILSVLNQYTNYNYKPEVKIEANGEIGKLSVEINHLRKAIIDMLLESNKNSITLQDSAKKLLENVTKLNSNSNQTSKNLNETVKNLKNISKNTQDNTKVISKMVDFSLDLKTSAIKGKELADHTLESMDLIDKEIKFIDETISLIDNIAFQTNILSLNAAVEAATAGDSGKGFAVVANEVRNLANKTLEASTKIKETVENAIQQAINGKEVTKNMILGYENLLNNIEQTLELVDDTKNRSIKQLKNIQDIEKTMLELDNQTKQNRDIASDTNEIATKTDSLSQKIVESLEEKVF